MHVKTKGEHGSDKCHEVRTDIPSSQNRSVILIICQGSILLTWLITSNINFGLLAEVIFLGFSTKVFLFHFHIAFFESKSVFILHFEEWGVLLY